MTTPPPAARTPARAKSPCRAGIESIDDLRCHLQVALELEHSTIPPYLCALYSIPDGSNVTASVPGCGMSAVFRGGTP